MGQVKLICKSDMALILLALDGLQNSFCIYIDKTHLFNQSLVYNRTNSNQ